MSMHLELDWNIGTIRIGDEKYLGAVPGSSHFDFVCSVWRKGDEAYLYAAHGKMSKRIFKAIKDALRDAGVAKVTYERLNTSEVRHREVDTSK